MISTPCAPQYDYRPTSFVAGSTQCVAPIYAEHRSRLFEGGTFFRSKEQGPEQNLIEIECLGSPYNVVNIYDNNVLTETYVVTFGAGSIADLRFQVTNRGVFPDTNPPSIIEMLEVTIDYYDNRTDEPDDGILGGLVPFVRVSLIGGEGGPTTDAGLASIRTGPERTMFILSTTEDTDGSPLTPPASKRVKQWNGTSWISYCNLTVGNCPLEGTC